MRIGAGRRLGTLAAHAGIALSLVVPGAAVSLGAPALTASSLPHSAPATTRPAAVPTISLDRAPPRAAGSRLSAAARTAAGPGHTRRPQTPLRRLGGSQQPAPPPPLPAQPAPVATPSPSVPVPAPGSSGPAFGAQFHGMWSSYSDAQRETVLSSLAAHGVRSVRIDLSWAMLQPTSAGSYDPWGVGFADSVIRMAAAHGLSPMVTLWLTPSWANGNAGERVLPTDPADYARAAGWAAARWRGTVPGWEVWNEPNSEAFLAGASATSYARLLAAAYPAIKAGDPGTQVVFGGTEYVDVEWVQQALASGAARSFDVMAVHPYMGRSDASPRLADDGTKWTMRHVTALHTALVAAGRGDAPIWFTEFGWSAVSTPSDAPVWNRGVSAETQAAYLVETVRMVREEMPYVTRVYWYDDLVGIEDGFNSGYGLVNPDGSATQALQAVATA